MGYRIAGVLVLHLGLAYVWIDIVGSTSLAFISGPRTWYNSERRKDATTRKNKAAALKGDKKSLLEVLPKVFSSVERLKGGLHRLQGLLIKMEQFGFSLPLLDFVAGMMRKHDKTNDPSTKDFMLHLVSETLEQNGWNTINATPIEYDESHHRWNDKEERRPKKRRTRTRPVPSNKGKTNPRRPMDLRSRNRVIDLWLSLDDDIGEGADGATADAYVDLEDFLVFG
jgi:hypothetical protein